nr:hypothetical protein [Escherichia coli]
MHFSGLTYTVLSACFSAIRYASAGFQRPLNLAARLTKSLKMMQKLMQKAAGLCWRGVRWPDGNEAYPYFPDVADMTEDDVMLEMTVSEGSQEESGGGWNQRRSCR